MRWGQLKFANEYFTILPFEIFRLEHLAFYFSLLFSGQRDRLANDMFPADTVNRDFKKKKNYLCWWIDYSWDYGRAVCETTRHRLYKSHSCLLYENTESGIKK